MMPGFVAVEEKALSVHELSRQNCLKSLLLSLNVLNPVHLS